MDMAADPFGHCRGLVAAGLDEMAAGAVPVGVALGLGLVVGVGIDERVADVGAGLRVGTGVAVTAGVVPEGVGGGGRTIR
jgi:hypothetical protein